MIVVLLFFAVTVAALYVTVRWPLVGLTTLGVMGVAMVVQGVPWLSVVAGGVVMGLMARSRIEPVWIVGVSGAVLGVLSALTTLLWERDLLRATVIEQLESVQMDEQLATVNMTVQQFTESILMLLPALMVSYMVVIMAMSYVVAARLFPRLGVELEPLAQASRWRLPFAMSWTFAAALALLVIGRGDVGNLSGAVGLNLVIVHGLAFFVVGLCVIGHRLARSGAGMTIRVVSLVMLVVASVPVPPIGLFLAGMGLFDLWYDFRKLEEDTPLDARPS